MQTEPATFPRRGQVIRTALLSMVLGLVLVGYPLVAAVTSIAGVIGTPFSIAMRVLLAGLCGVLLIGYSRVNRSRLAIWMLISALLFWVFYLLRMINDTLLESLNILLFEPSLYWLWAIGAALLPFLAMAMARFIPEDGTKLYTFVLFATLVTTFLVIPSMSTSYLTQAGDSYNGGRAQLEALNSISLGHLGVQLILLAVAGALTAEARLSVARLLLLTGCIMAGGYVALVANSRGPLVALVVCLTFLVVMTNVKGRSLILASGFVAILFIVPLVSLVDEIAGTSIYDRMLGQSQWDDVNTIGRIDIYSSAIGQFLAHPIFGAGLEDSVFGGYPHNLVIEAFMSTGLFGGIAFTALCVLGFVAAAKIARNTPAFTWLSLLAVQQIIAMQFSGSLAQAGLMWPLLGALIAVCPERYRHPERAGGNRMPRQPVNALQPALSRRPPNQIGLMPGRAGAAISRY